jgi:hypothetical protein
MKKKIVALGLAALLCVSTSMTAFAASSTKESNSSNTQSVATTSVEKAAPGAAVSEKAVTVKIAAADGTSSSVSLDTVISNATTTIVAAAATPENAVAAVQSLLTTAASPQFTATIKALAEAEGSAMVVNDMGTVKTAATAKDAYGNTIASAGIIKNVTSGALILLMSVNADGTVEYVEGVVDPITGSVLGAFQGTPSVITVLVLA